MKDIEQTVTTANLKKKNIARLVLYSELSKYYTSDQIDQMLVDIATHGTIDLTRYVKKSEVETEISQSSELPVQSKVIYQKLLDYYTKVECDEKYQLKESGKGLSTNDYTDAEKSKLGGLPNSMELANQLAEKSNKTDVYTKYETYNKDELNNLITTPEQKYVSVTATAETTAVTDLLPAEGEANTIYRVGNWDGTQYNNTCYSEYSWNGNEYVFLSTKPGSLVDEKYVNNSEYIRAYTDSENRILWGIKADGDIFFGVGVPSQVKDYISKRISEASPKNYDQVLAFLDGMLGTDTNLRSILGSLNITIATKVDKEEGKSLIDEEYASGIRQMESSEFIDIKVDGQEKIIEAIQKDGTKIINGGIHINEKAVVEGDILTPAAAIKRVNADEYIQSTTDSENKILQGIKHDGTTCIKGNLQVSGDIVNNEKNISKSVSDIETSLGNVDNIVNNPANTNPHGYLSETENSEWLNVITDSEGKVLAGIRRESGDIFMGNSSHLLNDVREEIEAIKNRLNAYNEVKEPNYVTFNINTINILSSTDADATEYDNARVFLPCVLQISSNMYYMYYGGLGKTDPNTDIAIHALFAYSTDGIHWTRGFPAGVEPPYPNEHNVFAKHVMDSYNVFRVPDTEFPYRMIGNHYNGNGVDMCYYKSADGIHWDENNARIIIPWNVLRDEWGYEGQYSDTFPTCIVRGNMIKIYMRLWKYYRYIGTMYIDLEGNIVKIPSIEIDIPKLYLAAGSAIDDRRELLLPTEYIGGESDAFQYRCLLVEGNRYKELNTNINNLISESIGWGYFGVNMVMVNNKQYVLLSDHNISHDDPAPITDYIANIKLVEVKFEYRNYTNL